MSEQELIYLLARLYIRLRLDGVSSNMRPIYHEVIDLLTAALGRNVENTTDSDIVDALRPRPLTPQRASASTAAEPDMATSSNVNADVDIENLSDQLDRLAKRKNKGR